MIIGLLLLPIAVYLSYKSFKSTTLERWVSAKNVTVFLMTSIWVYLAMSDNSPKILISIISGLIFVVLLTVTCVGYKRMTSNKNIDFKKAIGKNGRVSKSIPINGTGETKVVFEGQLRDTVAKSINNEYLAEGTHITVVDVEISNVDHPINILIVKQY
jgi:membrane protein implicated in regulation of membrane protease activity